MTATEVPTGADELTPAEAAARAGRGEHSIRRWVKAGQLPARRVLGRLRIRREDLDRMLAGEPVAPAPAGD